MSSPAADVSTLLAAAGLGLTEETNLFITSEPLTPLNVVTVYDPMEGPQSGTLDGATYIDRPVVQVRVRNGAYATGYALAKAIRDLLRTQTQVTIGTTTYIAILLASGIAHLGRIASTTAGAGHVWTMSFFLVIED